MSWEIPGVLVGGLCVLAIYSFLWKENPVYRFFEHLFVGVATGYGVVIAVTLFIWPDWLKPTLGFDLEPWQPYNPLKLLWFLPALFGLGMYFMLSRTHSWIARIVIGFGLGMAGGMAFQGFFADFLPQLIDSFRPLGAFSQDGGQASVDWLRILANGLFVVTLICVMTYFFFSFEHNRPGIKQASTLGRWLMMVTFGAFFGSTVMARMALLIDRLQFMITDWFRAIETTIRGG